MKTTPSVELLLLALAAGCRPEVGPPISQIRGPAILAVRGQPAEVDLRGGGLNLTVGYETLAVDASGRVPGPGTDITDPLLWSVCDQPKPPIESNAVSSECLDAYALPGVVGSSPTSYSATVSPDACSLFGPQTPPVAEGESPIRPRDPDITGGYYQPVRVELLVPEALRRAGMATGDSLISFHLQRIQCGLAGAPGPAIREYTANYHLNNNPRLVSVTVQPPGLDAVDLAPSLTPGSPLAVTAGQEIALAARWSDDSVETYPAWDLIERALVYHRESMRVSWYATGGSFEHDVSGRGEAESETFAENIWKSDTPGLVHLWLVLHDSRGGTDFAALDFSVAP